MRRILMGAAVLLMLVPLAGAQAASDAQNKAKGTKYEEAKGVYAYTGFAVAKTNFGGGDANLGFALGGGYRITEWIGADVDFYWAGRDQGPVKSRQFGLTFNGKVYPLGLFAPKTLDSFQPYFVMGMGGGNYKFKNGGSVKTGTFIFRMGAGVDWLLTDHFGLYTDVSLDATPGFKGGGNGGATGVYQLGMKYNF